MELYKDDNRHGLDTNMAKQAMTMGHFDKKALLIDIDGICCYQTLDTDWNSWAIKKNISVSFAMRFSQSSAINSNLGGKRKLRNWWSELDFIDDQTVQQFKIVCFYFLHIPPLTLCSIKSFTCIHIQRAKPIDLNVGETLLVSKKFGTKETQTDTVLH